MDLGKLGFEGVDPSATGRPAYHPGVLVRIDLYAYLNRIQSSRRLEREAQRNVELMWLTGRLMPDFKTIARFRKENGKAIRSVGRQFVVLCEQLGLFSEALVAIDGAKFKALNNRDRNFTRAKLQRRMEEIESSINRYLGALDTADRQEPAVAQAKAERLQDKITALKAQRQASAPNGNSGWLQRNRETKDRGGQCGIGQCLRAEKGRPLMLARTALGQKLPYGLLVQFLRCRHFDRDMTSCELRSSAQAQDREADGQP